MVNGWLSAGADRVIMVTMVMVVMTMTTTHPFGAGLHEDVGLLAQV